MIGETRIIDFLEALSSSKPTPGGGTASALAGSLAASLVCKVAVLTIGKKNYNDVQDEIKEINEKSKVYKEKLLELAEKDSEAFNKIINAYRITRELNDINEKKKILEEASKEACLVPLETANISYRVMELSERIMMIGNKNAFTDSLSAAYLAFSAINGAIENVFFTLKNISMDKDFSNKTYINAENIKRSSKELFEKINYIADEMKRSWS